MHRTPDDRLSAGATFERDDDVEDKLAVHNVTMREVRQVARNPHRVRDNPRKPDRVELLGYTDGGRALLVSLQQLGDDLWRPITAYDSPNEVRRLVRAL